MDSTNGFIILPKDTASLAEKISKLINNKEKRHVMGIAGRRRVEKEYREISRCIRPS